MGVEKGSVEPVPYVPSDRPRDVMRAYVCNELNLLCVWEEEFKIYLKKPPGELTEKIRALILIYNLLDSLEAQEAKGRR